MWPTGLKFPTAVVLPLFTDTAVPVLDTLVAVVLSEVTFCAVAVLPLTTDTVGLTVEATVLPEVTAWRTVPALRTVLVLRTAVPV